MYREFDYALVVEIRVSVVENSNIILCRITCT